MSKIYYESLKRLPKKFVSDKTKVVCFFDSIIAANEDFSPIRYNEKTKRWNKILLPKCYKKNHDLLKLR